MFTLICARINAWENNDEAGDLRRYRRHYDVIVIRWHYGMDFCNAINSFIYKTTGIQSYTQYTWPVQTEYTFPGKHWVTSRSLILSNSMHMDICTYLWSINIVSRSVLTNYMSSFIYFVWLLYVFTRLNIYAPTYERTYTDIHIRINKHRHAWIHISNEFNCYKVFSYYACQVSTTTTTQTTTFMFYIAMMMLKTKRTRITRSKLWV